MKLLILLAWRNVWRHSHRTFIILLAISLGVWSMLGISAFMRGMMNQQVNDAINNLVGHIQIHAPYYVDDPVIEHRFQPPNKALLTILNDKTQVQNWSMRIRVPAVINTERESTGITLFCCRPLCVTIYAGQPAKYCPGISFLWNTRCCIQYRWNA